MNYILESETLLPRAGSLLLGTDCEAGAVGWSGKLPFFPACTGVRDSMKSESQKYSTQYTCVVIITMASFDYQAPTNCQLLF